MVISLLAVALMLHLYLFSKMGRAFRIAGKEHVWDVIVNRNQFFFSDLRFFPLLAGTLTGLFQFIPEIIQNRLKLMLHLPLTEKRIITCTLAYGSGVTILLFLFQFAALLTGLQIHFANEIIISTVYTVLPWYLAGITAYFLCTAICIEPSWKHRLVLLLISIGLLKIFFISGFPAAYQKIIAYLPLITLIGISTVIHSVIRFKTGMQD